MTCDWHLRQARNMIRAGGVIAYPTESVWGLGCDPLDEDAMDRILQLKERDPEQGFILIAATRMQITPYLGHISHDIEHRMTASWPGPVTWIAPAHPDLPWLLTGGRDTIAVRVSAHPIVRALCTVAGMPLVSTSANPSGRQPARSRFAVERLFGDTLDYIVPGALGGRARPSEIRDASTGEILRPG